MQSAAGRAAYQANCASCHLPDLAGRNEAPALAGTNFVAAWGDRTTGGLLSYLQSTMPPGNAGALPQEVYLNLVAFLLEANGARAGSQPITAQTDVMIRSAATGQMPASVREALNRGSSGLVGGQPSRPKGLTVAGEVKNYIPVTDVMLRHPDPGDWLMMRRNYQ